MINLSIPYLKGNEKKYLNKCIETNFVSTVGKFVNEFETLFKKKLGYKYTTAVNSGTSALHLALKSVNVKKDTLVIMPSYTFAATANAAVYCNAEPWFFDINKSLNLDLVKLETILQKKTYIKKNKLFQKNTKKQISAIIYVLALGHVPDIKKLKKISNKFKCPLIIDAAAGHFSSYNNLNLSKYNLNCCYSFNGNKSLTTGSGGIFATNNKFLSNKFMNYANICKNKTGYGYNNIGFNYKMSNLNAAVGLAQLECFTKIKKIKKKIYKLYDREFESLKKFIKIKPEDKNDFVSWVYALNTNLYKKTLFELNKNKIYVKTFWKPLHLQKPYKIFLKEKLIYSERIWRKVITLPSSPDLSIDNIKKISQIIKRIDSEK